MKSDKANSILLALTLAVAGWTLKEVIALKVSVAEVRTKIGLRSDTEKISVGMILPK